MLPKNSRLRHAFLRAKHTLQLSISRRLAILKYRRYGRISLLIICGVPKFSPSQKTLSCFKQTFLLSRPSEADYKEHDINLILAMPIVFAFII